ncbi:NAC domain containing protein 50 [Sesamum alatum]|uniref:NAC domain containing protein 50 n=1 Tax=Sesamum alatum TaxID=300844 RepID=A0AAE1YIT3_9LAMI|nr:NAC domain containing protein 50 [Sesamum alatum]
MGQEVVVVAAVGTAAPPSGMGVPPPTSLAPGFRFHPTDEELVRYYLRRKACGKPFRFQAVTEIDVYKSEPWELAGIIFQKSGLGPPNGDRYAPFVEEEWDEDAGLVVPGGDADDDVTNGDEARVECTDIDQDTQPLSMAPPQIENLIGPQSLPFMCKRERSEDDPEPLSLAQSKRSKYDDPNSSHANGSEDSTTTSQDPPTKMTTTNFSSALLEFPLLEPLEMKENHPANTHAFDSSNLEKSVPPGYLKFISNLENEILNVSMERETLKIEVMRAQAMINILQSRIDILTKENEDLRRHV